jgi:predicted HTH transcriptional regulator
MAEWTSEKEFDRSSTVQVPPKNDDTINHQVNITKLSDRQRRIYETIKNGTINDTINDTINAKVLSEALGTSVITIKRDLYVLRDMNLIRYVGSNKTGHWEIVDNQ